MGQQLFSIDEVIECLGRLVGDDEFQAAQTDKGQSGLHTRSNVRQKFASRAANTNTSDETDGEEPWLDPVLIKLLLTAKRLRHKHFDSDLMQDPSWTMLLELACAHLQQTRVSVTSVCMASGAPDTTALRYLRLLEDDGLVERSRDLQDGRRTFVHLTLKARKSLAEMLGELRIKSSRCVAEFI